MFLLWIKYLAATILLCGLQSSRVLGQCPGQSSLLLQLDGSSYSGTGAWQDLSGNRNHAILGSGVVYDSAEQAFHFNGEGNVVGTAVADVNINPAVNPQVSIEMVLSPDPDWNPSASQGWVLTSDNGGYDRSVVLADVRFGSAPGSGVPGSVAAVPGYTYASNIGVPDVNGINHIVAVWDQSAGVDNGCFASMNGTIGGRTTGRNNAGKTTISIGGYVGLGANHAFKGLIYKVNIWSCAMDETAVQDRYNAFMTSLTPTITSTTTTSTTTHTTHTAVPSLRRAVNSLISTTEAQLALINHLTARVATLEGLTGQIRDGLSQATAAVPESPSGGFGFYSELDCPGSAECTPHVKSSNLDISINARNGTVKAETGACGEVDLCAIQQAIQMLASAYADPTAAPTSPS